MLKIPSKSKRNGHIFCSVYTLETQNTHLENNGEHSIVALGKKIGMPTPYNTTVLNMVHQVEKQGTFLIVDELLSGVSKAMQN